MLFMNDLVTSADKVLFLLYLFVYQQDYSKDYSSFFNKIRWKGDTWVLEETDRF